MNSAAPLVSIVVATVDRIDSLRRCLDGLDRLADVPFEIIVVVGPGDGSTEDYLAGRSDVATIVTNDTRNLSRSRNLGIDNARGDLIAFIDDDAYPTERWLADLVPEFDDPEVGAVGGEVFDYTGFSHQARYSRATRAGDSTVVLCHPIRGLTETPAARTFDYPMGTNLLVRRAALDAVGGFDEQYDYYLDETDLVRRLLDAGWIVRVVDKGQVFHKFLPSAIRGEQRVALDRRSILVNRAYFAARHQAPYESHIAVRSDFDAFVTASRLEIARALEAGIADDAVVHAHELAITEAELRLTGWLKDRPAPSRHRPDPDGVVRRRELVIDHPKGEHPHIVVVVSPASDAATLERRARAIAQSSGVIRVLTIEGPFSTVDLEGGVWRHRLALSLAAIPDDMPASATDPTTTATLAAEVDRINDQFWAIDVLVVEEESDEAVLLASRSYAIDGRTDEEMATSEPSS